MINESEKPFGRSSELQRFRREVNRNIGASLGYYGMAGMGKSFLLSHFAELATHFTPYIVKMDFKPGNPTAWKTGSAALVNAIMQLEATGKVVQKRRFWRTPPSPFSEISTILGLPQGNKNQYRNIQIAFLNGEIKENTQLVKGETNTVSNHIGEGQLLQATHAFGEAIRKLPVKMRFDGVQVNPTAPFNLRPLVIFLIDHLELASDEIIKWFRMLRQGRSGEYIYIVLVGRNPVDGLLNQALQGLSDDAARDFLVEQFKITDVSAQSHLIRICQGIPLCLFFAGKYVQDFHADAHDLDPGKVEAHLATAYFVGSYINRFEEVARHSNNVLDRRMLYLLKYAPILRVVDSPEPLQALLDGLENTNNTFPKGEVDFAELYHLAQRQSFIVGSEFHSVVRTLALHELRTREPDRWRELNRRAAEYYERNQKELEAFYHLISSNDNHWLELFKLTIDDIDKNNLAAAETRYGFMQGIEHPESLQLWFVLVEGLLAFAQGNHAKAELLLLPLLDTPNLPDAIQEHLQRWQTKIVTNQNYPSTYLVLIIRLRHARGQKNLRDEVDILIKLGINEHSAYVYDAAQKYYQSALDIAESIDYQQGTANALNQIGDIANSKSQYDIANQYYDRAITIYRSIGDRFGEADVLENKGEMERVQGQFKAAEDHYEQAYEIYRNENDEFGQARLQVDFGRLAIIQGRYDIGLNHLQEALEIYSRLEDATGQAEVFQYLGTLARHQRDYSAEQAYYDKAYTIFQRYGELVGVVNMLVKLGAVSLDLNQANIAEQRFRDAIRNAQNIGYRLGEANAWNGLGDVEANRKNYAKARGFYQDSLTQYKEIKGPTGQRMTLCALGHLELHQEHYEQALAFYQEALEVTRTYYDLNAEAIVWGFLANLARAQKQFDVAYEHYLTAIEIYQQYNDRVAIAGVYAQVCFTALDQKDYQQAHEYFWKLKSLLDQPESKAFAANFNQSVMAIHQQLDILRSLS